MNKKRLFLFFLLISILILPAATAAGFPLDTDDEAVSSALCYLRSCQQSDGGFAEEGRESNAATSTWTILAIAAAGENPSEWSAGGVSAADYLCSVADETAAIDGTAETSKMVISCVACGTDPRSVENYDFISMLKAKKKTDGRFGDHIYTTNWAIIALSAAGEDTSDSVSWLKSQQNDDGGFGWTSGVESDCDDTASTLMALIAGREDPAGQTVQNALSFLRSKQDENGGFTYGGSGATNTASDSWVILAIAAAGEDPSTWKTSSGNDPVSHLLSLRNTDGSFKWTSVLTDNPCRMTASALPALLGRPYPIIPGENSGPLRPSDAGEVPQPTIITEGYPASGTKIPEETAFAKPVTVTDDFGMEVTIPEAPGRIVSLAPTNTEILYALGLGSQVVGVTEYCNYPPKAAEKEKMGGYSTVNIEKVIAANPDLVVAAYGNTEEVVEHLKSFGLTVIALNPRTITDVTADIRLVGKATGTSAKSESLAKDIELRINVVKETASLASKRPKVAHLVWYDPIWVSGNNTFQNEIFTLCNAENAFGDKEGWQIVSFEEFVTAAPDVIIVNSGTGMGGESGKDLIYSYLTEETRLKNVPAVRDGRVYIIDSDIIDRGGPRIVDGIEMIAADIHPDLFAAEMADPEQGKAQESPLSAIFAFAGVFLAAGACALLRKRGKK